MNTGAIGRIKPIFLTSAQDVFSKDQTTETVGVIWWFARRDRGNGHRFRS